MLLRLARNVFKANERLSVTKTAGKMSMSFMAGGMSNGDNLRFFKNEIPSRPDGDYIDNIHSQWRGDYNKLEQHHNYIQWLFPLREMGVNLMAEPLTNEEAHAIRNDPVLIARAIKSLEMMLDFYGMSLTDNPITGPRVSRAPNWLSRYDHLDRSQHNYLRITRILKFLADVGLERYQNPILAHIAQEIKQGYLQNLKRSFTNFWLPTLRVPPFPRL
eukprot:TRINITY_DN4530_c0_g1_i1.p1 TRINITY_DN4530_c0_g1~~TRINITY_DN4530_c0_g1_i1.p1  ORF type:complete len:217 (+),score=88.75 TRINITY_DN4530_c0_g1_i1:316-966(+)